VTSEGAGPGGGARTAGAADGKPTLRVLLVEDSELDAAIVVRELQREYATVSERVETAAAMREALSRPWDLVCSDWHMPLFSATGAFALVKQAGLDLPFIIISGVVGEETAVDAMRAGVHDFIVKGSLSRLLPAVQRELREAKVRAEQRRMQQHLAISDRLASIGMIAAGVAHEINNPLAALVANIEAAQEALALARAIAEDQGAGAAAPAQREVWRSLASTLERGCVPLDDAGAAAGRIRDTAQDLKVFSKAHSDEKTLVDVRRVLDSCARMAATATRHCARVVRDFAEVPPILASEGRISQVFLNLILNAAQAISEGHAAENEIRLVTRFDAANGRVVVEVRDTGCGIPEENLPRIFDPFFTTKPSGIGTGLGLSICERVVAALDGRIGVRSRVGEGSTFTVELPAAPPQALPATRRATAPVPSGLPAHRRGRVLVVDDDAIVGRAVARVLERDNEVVALDDPAEALRRITAHEQFDVVLCDLMMPEMTGMELYDRVRETAPEQAERVVFLTGGVFTAESRAFLERVPNACVEKPFQSDQLRAIVGDAISGRASRPAI
jgi:signal transduction histidine kinase